jgi:hypothetical protein
MEHRVLQDEQLSIAPLFPEIGESICEAYQSIILSNPELSTEGMSEGDSNELRSKQDLAKDLMSLQDSDLLAVQQVTPVIFKFLPHLSVGNKEIIRILVSSLLPDKVEESDFEIGHYNYMKTDRSHVDVTDIGSF